MPIVSVSLTIVAPSFPAVLEHPAVALALALIGISLTVFFARRYRVNPRIVYQMHDSFVIGQPDASSLGDIKVMFNDTAVPRVIVTQLGIWNAGNMTVRRNDIVATDPLAFHIKEGFSILGSTVLKKTRAVNDFQIKLSEEDRSRALLEFDYLDAGDGAVFQVIHTGTMNGAKLTGSLRGVPRGLEDWGDLQEWSDHKSRLSSLRTLVIVVATISIFTWIKDLIVAHYPTATKYFDWMLSAIAAIVGLFFVFLIGFIVVYTFRTSSRATPKPLLRK